MAARAWHRVHAKITPSISDDDFVTLGSKLESFGLATRVETGVPWELPVFRPLGVGTRFIEYIQGRA